MRLRGSIPRLAFTRITGKFNYRKGGFMNYKKHVKHILRQIEKAFNKADSIKEYEELCECIYFSDCQIGYDEFLRLKKLVF